MYNLFKIRKVNRDLKYNSDSFLSLNKESFGLELKRLI
jgi:hypothetical protein